MRLGLWFSVLFSVMICFVPALCRGADVMGELVSISDNLVTATFPVAVEGHTMMTIMCGRGDAVAGLAISEKCAGNGPFTVTGKLYFITKPEDLKHGIPVRVNSLRTNAANIPNIVPASRSVAQSTASGPADQDLKFYYYAAGQPVGYGAVGFGYDRTVKLTKDIGLELDGAMTTVGSVDSYDENEVNNDQLIKNLGARLKIDISPGIGIFSGYRWNAGRGDASHWSEMLYDLGSPNYVAPSNYEEGEVVTRGIEYGITLRPARRFTLSLGFIPQYRIDIGSLGAFSQEAYTAEMRFGTSKGAIRLRGIKSEDYWSADLGFTIQ